MWYMQNLLSGLIFFDELRFYGNCKLIFHGSLRKVCALSSIREFGVKKNPILNFIVFNQLGCSQKNKLTPA